MCEGYTDLSETINQWVLDYLLMKYDDPDINELLNVCTYLDPRFKGSYIDEADITLVEYHLTKASVDEDQDSTSEPAASTLPTFGDFTEASLSKKSGIKKQTFNLAQESN